MYDFFLYLYSLGVAIDSLFNAKVKKMWRGEHQAFNILREKVDPEAKYIWFHAASLGEFEQGRPLMECIHQAHPEYKILLTFFSPSGYEVRKDYQGADIICYLPLDTPFNAKRFLELIHPVMAFFIKYEFWRNYLNILKKRNIPTYSVSSIFREKQIFFRWYGCVYAHVLKCFTRLFVQNQKSKDLLEMIGVRDVDIVGDTRFDRVLQIKEAAKPFPVVEAFKKGYKVFIAGSSWPPDEDIFIKFFNEHPDWRLVIAPHVITPEHLKQIQSKLKMATVYYTDTTPEEAAHAQCLVINCFGLLSGIYRYVDVAYIGGGFGVGIHNTLEAGVWNVPVIFGPNNKRFREAQGLLKSGGGFEIQSYEDFEQLMNTFLKDPAVVKRAGDAAGAFVRSLAGATQRVFDYVEKTVWSKCGRLH